MSKNVNRFRRPSLKQVVLSSLGGSIGVVGILFTVALYVVETLIRPQKHNLFDEYTFSPYEFDMPAESVTFPPLQGDHEVNGWYVPREGATTTILVCPGYRSRKADLLGLSVQLWKAGHNLLIFDYYGHGNAIGKPVTLGYREISDFLGAVAYAKERAPQARLGVAAYSMGAAIAIMAAARNSEVEAVVADSAFATHWSVVDYNVRHVFPLISTLFVWLADYLMWLRAGYRFRQVEPIRDIGSIAPRPILIIHGGKDSMVDPHDATLLYRAANEPKELWLLPNADHCGAYFEDRRAYTMKVIDFFDLYLKKPRLQLVDDAADMTDTINSQGLSEAS